MTVEISKFENGVKFSLKVVPKSSKNQLIRMDDGRIKLKITAAPVDGKANEAVIRLLSDLLKVSRADIKILSGEKSRDKTIQVNGNVDLLVDKLVLLLEED